MSGLAKESAEEMANYSLHMADSGTDNFDRDFALSLLSSDQDAIYEIEEALKRIEKNTYGICELTGKPIPKARAGSHSLDALHRRGAKPVGTRRGVAPAAFGPAGHGGHVRRDRSGGRGRSRGKARQGERNNMPREIITIECTEARKEGKSPSRYTTTATRS
jgi:hypothetical protein